MATASQAQFMEAFYTTLKAVGVKKGMCELDEERGMLVMNVGKGEEGRTRVVPVASLAEKWATCAEAADKASLLDAATGAFGRGLADIPREFAECGSALLPQLWPVEKVRNLGLIGVEVPHCGWHGETTENIKDLAVVLVYEHIAGDVGSKTALPIETPVLVGDILRWDVSFVDGLRAALENLRSRTKAGPAPEQRWEHHASGCGQSCWGDRFDAARAALLPALVAKRRRKDGQAEPGGHVIALATPSCVFASTSKNPIGLCFMGETLHVKMAGQQRLSTTPYRLLKMKQPVGKVASHPLNQTAGEGLVWRWLPYAPGGPPTQAAGEFSVPVEIGEVDGILNAIEHGKPVPVFSSGEAKKAPDPFFARKEIANNLFKAGEFVKAIAAYDAALKNSPPTDADAAVVHSNAAQAILKLAETEADPERKEACAAEALRRATLAGELDPTNMKAHARCAAACDLLGESAAAAEFRARGQNLSSGGSAAASIQASGGSVASSSTDTKATASSEKAFTPPERGLVGSSSIPHDCKAEA